MIELKSQNKDFSPEKPMFPISIVAEMLGVHQRTLRIYDEMDLLSPRRSPKNRRLYSFNDIEKGKFIQYLTKDLGINLAGVKIISHLLEQGHLDPKKFTGHLESIAKELNITQEMQEENRLKLSKRGRKKSEE